MSSNSCAVTKLTLRLSLSTAPSAGYMAVSVSCVSQMASTMDSTVVLRKSILRFSGSMTFSQSHWSTYTECRLSSSSSSRRMAFMSVYMPFPG